MSEPITKSAAKLSGVTPEADVDVDVLVIGAGFSGLYMLHRLRQAGFSATLVDTASDVGGTWYWNSYPGARTDSEQIAYCLFLGELYNEWNWSERYPPQGEVQDYLRYVCDKFGLRENIQFNTRVDASTYDELRAVWRIRTGDGREIVARFVVSGMGTLSCPYVPEFPGLDQFMGDVYLPQRWPQEPVDFAGKRVGIVGTGATAVQIIPEIAPVVEQLVVFQRTAQYVVPANNVMLTDADRAENKKNFNDTVARVHAHPFAQHFISPNRMTADVTEEERQRIYEKGWERGGFCFMFETFDDVLTDADANEAASEFIKSKIRESVSDPKVADLLVPVGHPYGARRPPGGHGYYEAFNRSNVSLVDIRQAPIEFTSTGIRAGGSEYKLDAVILATGFDSHTGAYDQIDITGCDGVKLKDRWKLGPRTYLSLMFHGFPNMFSIYGPHAPFSNVPPVSQRNVEWIVGAMKYMRDHGYKEIDAAEESERQWVDRVEGDIDKFVTVQAAKSVRAFHLGANIPGKAIALQNFFGGAEVYFKLIEDIAADGYRGFNLAKREESVPA